MIPINGLTQNDKSRWVEYNNINTKEKGRIKSWNDKWIFVVYNCADNWDNYMNYTGCATSPEDLTFLPRPK